MPLVNRVFASVSPIVANDNEQIITDSFFVLAKEGRFIKDKDLVPVPRISYFIESKGDGNVNISIDDEISARSSFIVASATSQIFKGSFDITDLVDGIHSLKINAKANAPSGSISVILTEVYER